MTARAAITAPMPEGVERCAQIADYWAKYYVLGETAKSRFTRNDMNRMIHRVACAIAEDIRAGGIEEETDGPLARPKEGGSK